MPIPEIALLLFLFVIVGIIIVAIVAVLAFVISGIIGRYRKKKDKGGGDSTLANDPDPSSS